MKHIKLFDVFINEMKVQTIGNSSDLNLIDAGVEIPAVKIDARPLGKLLNEIWKNIREIESLSNTAKTDKAMIDSVAVKKLERTIKDDVNNYNKLAERIFGEFKKAIEDVKFPVDADYTVEWKPGVSNYNMGNPSGVFIDIEKKENLELYDPIYTISYKLIEGRARKESTFFRFDGVGRLIWEQVAGGRPTSNSLIWDSSYILNFISSKYYVQK